MVLIPLERFLFLYIVLDLFGLLLHSVGIICKAQLHTVNIQWKLAHLN